MLRSNFTKFLSLLKQKIRGFFQILHQSSGSWDITSLYFLAKILYTLRSLSKYKFGEILREPSKFWNCALWFWNCALCPNRVQFQLKKVQKSYLSWHWTVIQSLKKNSLLVWKMTRKIWWNLTWAVKNLKICTLMGHFGQKY